jgi:RNase adaptor protein for sRNA GlmZ degradation
MQKFLTRKTSLKATANALKILFMKPNDSDLISEYNSTRRLGNPDTAAAGDSKQLRENMHDTTNATTEVPSAFDQLMEQRAYKEFVEHFSDTVVSAEELLNFNRLAEGILAVLKEQQEYHAQKVLYYTNILKELTT